MDFNEIVSTVINQNDAWHENAGRAQFSLSDELAIGLNEATSKLAAAVHYGKDRAEVDKRAANLIFSAILCTYRAGVGNIEGALTNRLAELNDEAGRAKAPNI